MIKKFSYRQLSFTSLSFLCAICSISCAAKDNPFSTTITNHFNGFYLGSQIGYDDLHIDYLPPDYASNSIEIFNSGRGLNLGIALGTGASVNKFYLGIESFGNISRANAAPYAYYDGHGNRSVTGHSLIGTTGIDLIPGLIQNENAILYGRIGYGKSFITQVRENSINNELTVDFNDEKNKHAVGLHTGVGVQVRLSDLLDLRAEQTHLNFRAIDDPDSDAQLRPSMNTFNLALIWHVN